MGDLKKGFVVAGIASGVGKTTVALALMSALRKRGLAVQPFKCGPDFIDGGHHMRASGRQSRNLDGWMLSAGTNRDILSRSCEDADVCVVEGVMGLFDGVDGSSDTGSTAEIAKWMGLPVILVVDASSAARSVAALVHGFATFDRALNLAGVIFNRVAGPSHYRLLHDAVTSGTRVRPLGYLPSQNEIGIPERYLGLFTASEDLVPSSTFALLGELAEHNIDIDRLLESVSISFAPISNSFQQGAATVRIGVARDKVFSFYYEDNLDALRRAGAEIVEFSPLKDSQLPKAVDALYFGGGYPELFARELAANQSMIQQVRRAAEANLPIYAECGGLMYLGRDIVTRDASSVRMAGVLPIQVEMTERLVNFGYTEVSFTSDCLLGNVGSKARGHSFHCSKICDAQPMEHVYQTMNSLTKREEREGFRVRNVLASYIHLHFQSNRDIAQSFVQYLKSAKARRTVQEANNIALALDAARLDKA